MCKYGERNPHSLMPQRHVMSELLQKIKTKKKYFHFCMDWILRNYLEHVPAVLASAFGYCLKWLGDVLSCCSWVEWIRKEMVILHHQSIVELPDSVSMFAVREYSIRQYLNLSNLFHRAVSLQLHSYPEYWSSMLGSHFDVHFCRYSKCIPDECSADQLRNKVETKKLCNEIPTISIQKRNVLQIPRRLVLVIVCDRSIWTSPIPLTTKKKIKNSLVPSADIFISLMMIQFT